MAIAPPPPLVILLLLLVPAAGDEQQQLKTAVGEARVAVELARSYVGASISTGALLDASDRVNGSSSGGGMAWMECDQLYLDSEYKLRGLTGKGDDPFDARTWITAAITSHRTCLDGLVEKGLSLPVAAENVTSLLRGALAAFARNGASSLENSYREQQWNSTAGEANVELLASWTPSGGKRAADVVVAKDGSGDYRTINQAVAVLARRKRRRGKRLVVYVKAGVYEENVEIGRDMRNVMFVGDGAHRTVVTGRRSALDGFTTYGSATFGITGDGFWARDIAFENTAGPAKQQAVALRVASDRSAFYRCAFRGYQDTLFAFSGRQFYLDCSVHGTIDFVFGNAAAVLQRCTIVVHRPLPHQYNTITAQGRDDPDEDTGIVVHDSRVVPATDLVMEEAGGGGRVRTFLGRPWRRYSRVVFMRTEMDGVVHRRGWAQWRGRFALGTLYYGEYMNKGRGARTRGRVRWPGFHVLRRKGEAEPFTVRRFIQGERWLPETGIAFSAGI